MSEFAAIRHALEIARQNGFSEVEIEAEGVKFFGHLEPRKPIPQPSIVIEGIASHSSVDRPSEITSPCVGYFAPNGDELKEGANVEPDQVVATITALGLANEVESKLAGEVLEVLVKRGDPVEYGQPLYRVKVTK